MDTHELVLTSGAFAELVRRLAAGRDGIRVSCGLSRLPERWEWLVANVGSEPAEPPAPVEFDKQVAQLVNAAATPPPPERPAPAPQLPRRPAYQYD